MSVEPEDALDAEDATLVRAVDDEMAGAVQRAGPLFACGPGRTDCCRGPFPINLLDARRLQRGLEALARASPERSAAARARAEKAVARLAPGFPGNASSGLLTGDEGAEEAFARSHAVEPCPTLDPATGLCDLYEWRPLACRTLGPPVRIGETDLAPCPYCFRDAPPADIERCRARPDPEGREDAIVAELERRLGLRGDTIIAFALAGLPPALG